MHFRGFRGLILELQDFINGANDRSFTNNGAAYVEPKFEKAISITNICYASDSNLLISSHTNNEWKSGWSSVDFTCIKAYQDGREDMSFGDSGSVSLRILHIGGMVIGWNTGMMILLA